MQRYLALASIHLNACRTVLESSGLQHPDSMLQSCFIFLPDIESAYDASTTVRIGGA